MIATVKDGESSLQQKRKNLSTSGNEIRFSQTDAIAMKEFKNIMVVWNPSAYSPSFDRITGRELQSRSCRVFKKPLAIAVPTRPRRKFLAGLFFSLSISTVDPTDA